MSRLKRNILVTKLIVILIFLGIGFWLSVSAQPELGGGHTSSPSFAELLFSHSIAVATAVLLIEGVFFFIDAYGEEENQNELIEKLVDGVSIKTGIDLTGDGSALMLSNYRGIRKVYKSLDFEKLDTLSRGSKRLDILNTWLPDEGGFYSTFSAIELIVSKNGNVRILLANAASDYVRARRETLGRDVSREIRSTYEKIKNIFYEHDARDHNIKNNLEVRLYNGVPPCSLYGVGNESFAGIFGVQSLAVECFQLNFMRNSEFGGKIWEQFENLWERSVKVDLERPISEWGHPDDSWGL